MWVRNRLYRLTVVVLLLAGVGPLYAAAADIPAFTLDQGFRLLYDLNFDQAHQVFASWQQQHPDDPMGPIGDAAGSLFAEFNRLGLLEAQFYEDDRKLEARPKLVADPAVRDRFNAALAQAENRAQARLAKDPDDRDALLAMALASGLRADYAALIEKRNVASLHFTKVATRWGEKLLAADPQCYDAHLATGISQYLIGSMNAPVRWLVRLGGLPGNKQSGIHELEMTAEKGRYLAPFARILLAIAYVREKDTPQARQTLVSLRNDFPQNPLFAREIDRLDAQR